MFATDPSGLLVLGNVSMLIGLIYLQSYENPMNASHKAKKVFCKRCKSTDHIQLTIHTWASCPLKHLSPPFHFLAIEHFLSPRKIFHFQKKIENMPCVTRQERSWELVMHSMTDSDSLSQVTGSQSEGQVVNTIQCTGGQYRKTQSVTEVRTRYSHRTLKP